MKNSRVIIKFVFLQNNCEVKLKTKIMLLRLIMKNFLSFHNEETFDMFPNPKRERFVNHVYLDTPVPVLKQAAIYGPNASGKSNLIKAFSFLKWFVTDKDFNKKVDFEDYRYHLSGEKEPFMLTIEFVQGKTYIYTLQVNGTVSEKLWISGLGESDNHLVFERNGMNITGPVVENETSSRALLSKNGRTSVFALNEEFPILSGEDVKNVYRWFKDTLTVATLNYQINMLIQMLSVDKKLLDFANDIFVKLNISEGLEIQEKDFNSWLSTKNGRRYKQSVESGLIPDKDYQLLSHYRDRRNEFNIVKKDGTQVVQEFIFRETGIGGYHGGMDIDSQSDGTVRLLTLIPLLYHAIEGKKVVVIDEIDNSLHSELVCALIRYYGSRVSSGQLIFTTHETRLMNQQELIRVDELWLVEKKQGNSSLRCLNDYKIHGTINIEHGYQEGRFGGTPNVGILTDEAE